MRNDFLVALLMSAGCYFLGRELGKLYSQFTVIYNEAEQAQCDRFNAAFPIPGDSEEEKPEE